MAFFKKKPLTIILVFIAILQILLFYYYTLSVDREYRAAKADLSSQAFMLTSNIEERASIVKGVSSFVQTVGFDAGPSVINGYLSTAYHSTNHLMNMVIAPDGIIRYLYPIDGNTAILNKSLLLDPKLSTPGMIQETIRSRSITVDGPRMLAQGEYGMVIRQALFKNNSFEGIVSVTLRINDIISHFLGSNSEAYITGMDHAYLFGSHTENKGTLISIPIRFYNQSWLINTHLDPRAKWNALISVLLVDFSFLSIIASVLYFFTRQRRFNRELEQVVNIRTRDLRISERLYEKLAYYDSLTEIPNRRFFMDEFDRLLKAAEPAQTFTLFFFDLNRFKEINDTLGHSAGDRVIRTLARRIHNANLPCRLFARTGGDEFVMLFQDLPRDQIPEMAEQLSAVASKPLIIAGTHLNLSTSIGISLYPEHSTTKEDLLKYADMSMYQAKSTDGQGYYLFDNQLREKLQQKTMIAKYLHSALENHEFVLHYQPQVNAATGDVIGLEALVRWNHPEKGLLLPGYFISAVEEAGLMTQLTDWVIHEVCRQLAAWKREGLQILRTSVNISNSWFYNRNLIPMLMSIFGHYGLAPDCLEFEITESTALLEEHYPLLQQMRDRGIIVSVDDFGTKYSSLNYLKHFPVNKIKIDRTFIVGIGQSSIDETIIKSIAYVASQLGYHLIAEGVEKREQANFLLAHGCKHVQGFLFYRPLPAGEIGPLLKRLESAMKAGTAGIDECKHANE
ncbi:putative bifunctional diguanylate cyclase/phosphodiesterase [Paenibacillus rhizophilus]|uniref:EAL domain-containing protein n=1 Tax=Paenibacillus rhizophilus TaxID=1850366 RepID=A0A3N9P3A6_9BACL|nr:EAL domain-containing protein [Paenibacillus rhizophilus]RQW10285.1 EAL domain-containing protein [Paenibacillus rhizophilus]